jgi:mannose-6-phosphate isomerase-like protein (cupin superfamily)
MHQYGLAIDQLPQLIQTPPLTPTPYGSHALLASAADYRLERLAIQAGHAATVGAPADQQAILYVEEGAVSVAAIRLAADGLISLPPSGQCRLEAAQRAVIYVFSGAPEAGAAAAWLGPGQPFDCRAKYWGDIRTIINQNCTGKRMFFRKGQHSSLHFHCAKTETYFIHSGRLFVRLRAGRGEDRFFELEAGQTLLIPPGLMHQDGARQDTVIIEVSTHDEDSDSFIVEDGARCRMPRLAA